FECELDRDSTSVDRQIAAAKRQRVALAFCGLDGKVWRRLGLLRAPKRAELHLGVAVCVLGSKGENARENPPRGRGAQQNDRQSGKPPNHRLLCLTKLLPIVTLYHKVSEKASPAFEYVVRMIR